MPDASFAVPADAHASDRFARFASAHPPLAFADLESSPLVRRAASDPLWGIARSEARQGQHDAGVFPREVLSLFLAVRDTNRALFASIEAQDHLQVKTWEKLSKEGASQGGGVMSVHRGDILEKAAVNSSVVWGDAYPSIEKDYAGKPYAAGGVSLICHPRNPNAPIAHMNIRVLRVGEGESAVTWIGGGADLTPMVRFEEDTGAFHDALRGSCERNRHGDYAKYTKWCDEYFFIPHRGDTRGVGGVFFDYVHIGEPSECALLLDLGQTFTRVYGEILARRVEMPYDDELKERHLHWRGRYAEFNLVYDRGTRFGLMSGGNPEAILASLPPVVKW